MNKNNNVIVVSGEEIETTMKEIDIFQLEYWPDNPRVHSILHQNFPDDNYSQNDIESILWKEDSIKDLFYDIKSNEGLIDEIIVKENIVLEGNSRLCAYRNLFKKAKNEREQMKWNKIRARIIPKDTSNEIIFTILGTWHIKGKKEWRTFEKAAYIFRMFKEYHKSNKDIAKMVNKSESEVNKMIETYSTMIQYDISDSNFSAIYEIVKNIKMKQFKNEKPILYKKCIISVKEGKFNKAEKVRHLPKVITDKKARKMFFEDNQSFDDALDVAKSRHPEHEDSFYNQINKVTFILKHATMKKIEEIKDNKKKQFILKKLYTEISKLCKKTNIITK